MDLSIHPMTTDTVTCTFCTFTHVHVHNSTCTYITCTCVQLYMYIWEDHIKYTNSNLLRQAKNSNYTPLEL